MRKYLAVIVILFLAVFIIQLQFKGGIFRNHYETLLLWSGVLDKTPYFASSFESEAEVEKSFALDKIEPHSWSLTGDYKSHGNKCLVITIKDGDKVAIDEGKRKGSERAEFQDPLYAPFTPDLEIWHRIDFMILNRASLPVLDERLVFMQLKQFGGNNPLFSIRYDKGRFSIKQRYSNYSRGYKGRKAKMKKWHRLVFHSKITKSQDGFMDVYLDGAQVIQYKGRTAYPRQPALTFCKFGLYRDHYVDADKKLPPMTIFFDRYIRGSSWGEVVPEGDPMPRPLAKSFWPHKLKTVKGPKIHLFNHGFWDSTGEASTGN
jgi:hypothetical protein